MSEAAQMLGVSQPTISRIERGGHLPSPGTIAKLSEKSGGEITGPDLYRAWEDINRTIPERAQ